MPLQQPTLMNSTVQHPVQHPVQLPVQHGGQHSGQHPVPVTDQKSTNSHLLNNRHNDLAPLQEKNPLQRGDCHLSSSSDDNVQRLIQGTHAPDGRKVNVKPLLHIVEDILHRATPSLDGVLAHEHDNTQAHMDDKTQHVDFNCIFEEISYTIHKIACEISFKCSGGGDVHTTTLALFNSLSSYSWDAKVVIALAALAVNYGELWFVAQLYNTNKLAKLVGLLKQLPDILKYSEMFRPRFEALKRLTKAMLDVTICIVKFTVLPVRYFTPDTPAMTTALAHIPTAAYWIIRSVVACSSQMTCLIGVGHEYMTSTTEAWELSSLAHKVNNIHGHLTNKLYLCREYIDRKRQIEAYQMFRRLFEAEIHSDNMNILRELIYAHDKLPPLVEGSTKKRVDLDVLRRKTVLLLITDLEIPQEELTILEQMYEESRHQPTRTESQYEVLWIPIVDRTLQRNEPKEKEFENLQMLMPWYTVHHPSFLKPTAIEYFKEEWRFQKKHILVVLDPQGTVVSRNALHMMWIWGSRAFPFTRMREEALWKEESWRLEFLVDGIDPLILYWINEGRFICLYGGEDIDWIRKFTITARNVAQAARIPLELVYVGKSNPKERVRKTISMIIMEKLSHTLQDLTYIWFFWVRLESMLYSRMQHGKTVKNDTIMEEIMTMLSFDVCDQGWAVIRGLGPEMLKAKGKMILTSFTEYDAWKEHVEPKGFLPALTDHLHQLPTPHHCNQLILPGTSGSTPEMVFCADCGCPMEKYFMYSCCTD